MKNLFLLTFFVGFLISCQQPVQEKIVEEKIYDSNYKEFVNIQVYPNNKYSEYLKSPSSNTPSQDWELGIIYKENAKSFDTLIHEIDLSLLTGNKQALVYLEVKVINHGMNNITGLPDDESGQIYLRGKNSLTQWQSVSPHYNEYIQSILILTDETGKIEWYHEHNWDFWSNPTCDPGFEIYKWEQIAIIAKWLVVGININN